MINFVFTDQRTETKCHEHHQNISIQADAAQQPQTPTKALKI